MAERSTLPSAPLILVADDEPEIRELVSDVLEGAGFRTVTAADGAEVVELAVASRPVLIVMDLMMPRMDGYTTLTHLRSEAATHDIPVIIMTGQGESFRPLSTGVGAVAHVAKPFSPGSLAETVRRVLADHEARVDEERALGKVLVERGTIAADDLRRAVEAQRETGQGLDEALLASGVLSVHDLSRVRAELLGIAAIEAGEADVDLETARAIPEAVLRQHQAFPVCRVGDVLTVMLADPTNRQAVLDLEALTGAKVTAAIASRETIGQLLDRAFPPSADAPGHARRMRPRMEAPVETDPTGVAQVYALLLDAVREEATELHFEPLPQEVRVRSRVEGRFVERARLTRALLAPILARFRLLAGLSDETSPQQAYMRTRLAGREVEIELSFFPTLHGEAVTAKVWREGLVDPDPILAAAIAENASDIYLLEGTPPTLKVHGVATPLAEAPPLTEADLRKLLVRLVPEASRKEFETTGEADLSFVHGQFGRFRLNCYRAMGATGMVLRRVKTELPTFASLDLPPLLGTLVMERQGLILIVGATGSGKSTTVAAMLDHRNANAPGHIVTIEDPVEFIHTRKKSVISQREVGIDTESYLVALQKALRQAPDVIFVGELRDRATVEIALHSAETGHLVLSTLHATNATGAVERLLNFFPSEARESMLMQLSLMVRAVIAQRLVPRADGTGRVAAMEIMLSTSRIQALIRRGELETIRQAIEEGVNEGLQTIDQGLLALYLKKAITQEDALRFADSPNNLRLRMKGIK